MVEPLRHRQSKEAAISNSGRAVKLSVNILAGCRVLSAVDTVITVNQHFD